MKLSEMVAELRENILHDRSDRTDGDEDRLWSTPTLVRYINDACRRFARLTFVLQDNRSEVTRVVLQAGVTEYPLHPAVLAVRSARVQGAAADLKRVGHSVLDRYRAPEQPSWDPSALLMLPEGPPVAFATDEALGEDDNDVPATVVLRVYPTPTAAEAGTVVQMRLTRLPLESLSADHLNEEPEIPAEYHLDVLDWAAYLALRIVDRDAEDVGRAMTFRGTFQSHVTQARKEMLRKMFAPQGFDIGQHGFSWSP